MKVYISADMEGITGLVDAEDVQPPGRDYERGRGLMTEDVNAAVRGAYAAGASYVLVNDAHGPMRNLLPDLLDPRALLIKGRPKPMGMIEGLTVDFDAVVCVGFHARAGTLGVLSHSFMGHEIEDIWLDDKLTGEIGLLHAAASTYGVPVAALTGDNTACTEATAWDSQIHTYPVKQAKDRFAAQLVPVAESRSGIEQTVQRALTTLPTRPDPARPASARPAAAPALAAEADSPALSKTVHQLTVRWQSASVASHLLAIPGLEKTDDRTITTQGDMLHLYRLFNLYLRVATAVTSNPPYC
ncbi:M55 family metallopeptidase [Kribbella italica]|uniref:D-amino peptidase n=1 Tax=Kribbella italica TaxID=1540520 RepID=A0A7W9MYX3_9ACTN|nr:D-amino peptidase [Kribbella italica]